MNNANKSIGFYTVNNVVYGDKFLAVLEAQKTLSDLKWHFHDDTLRKYNWALEPTQSLDELYKLRAIQLREQYDYLIVQCSGGADSTNVIWSFLNNNILVDEVITSYPFSGLNNWNFDPNDKSAENTVSEMKFAALPLLHEIKTRYPSIKITLHDTFEEIQQVKSESWLYENQLNDYISPVPSVSRSLESFNHIKDLAEQGKRIGVVYGVEKPMIRVDNRDSKVYAFISDYSVNIVRNPFKTDYLNVDSVLFYLTSDMPELMIKQAHVVSKYVFKPENYYIVDAMEKMFTGTKEGKNNPAALTSPRPPDYYKTLYHRSICAPLYPSTWKQDVWQADKNSGGFLSNAHGWFQKLHSTDRVCSMMIDNVMEVYKKINPKYITAHGTGFKANIKYFYLGNTHDFRI